MKDLLEDQQWRVERFKPDTAPVQAECSKHYTILPLIVNNASEQHIWTEYSKTTDEFEKSKNTDFDRFRVVLFYYVMIKW